MLPWYLLKYYAERHTKFAVFCGVLLISSLMFYNFFNILFILWAYVGGIILVYSFLRPDSVVPNLLPMFSKKSKNSDGNDELTLMKSMCTVCGLRKCPRHRPELNILAFQPWTNLDIRQSVDSALDEFFNIVLKDFVYTWYRDISEDEEFVDELRTNFRFLASVMFRRLIKMDVPQVVTQRMLRAGMQHIDLCMQAYKEAGEQGDLQSIALEYMSSHLHCAMWSRKAELEYLRRLVEALFPYILRRQALNSRSTCALVRELFAGSVLLPTMDAIANPDLINNLLLVFFDNTPPPVATEPPSPMVPFLGRFSQAKVRNQSCLRLKLQHVINRDSPELLYPFMQFLKSEAAVNVLQFCLACEDFNRRILSPDVSQSEFMDLHMTAKDLYKSYCAPDALDRIKFEEDIIENLRKVVEGPPDQVIRLRTSTPLFKAYEHAYNLLENNFLPLFHQSDDYYNMICGGRPNSSISRQLSRVSKKKDFSLAQLSKLKDVFKSADEKSLGETDSVLDMASIDGDIEEDDLDDYASMHDLSTWRVTIPIIGGRPDPQNDRKPFYVFIIDVRRVDVREDDNEKSHWTVARRYREFYVLEQKFTEFHGEFLDCQLPSKSTFGTKSQQFIEGKKGDFEAYLQKLLTKPQLKSSQLLYNFLTSDEEFSTKLLPDIKFGKFVKTKLVKEKGQHLDPFLVNFTTSTEAAKPKPSKLPRRGSDASLLSTTSEKLMGTHFENNANSGFSAPFPSSPCKPLLDVEGAFDSVAFVAQEIYKCPQWLYKALMSARILVKDTMENYLEFYLNRKIDQVTQEHRVVSLIRLLQDVLFFDNDPPRTEEEKAQRYEQVYREFIEYIPAALISALGTSNTTNGCQALLQIFQQPKLNKQLTYVLLDIFIKELFPELILPNPGTDS